MLHSLKTNTPSHLISNFNGKVTCVAFYPFKKNILVACGEDGTVCTYDININVQPQHFKQSHSAPITGLAFAPCNKHFYCTVGLDKTLRFHDIMQGTKG